MYFNVAQFIIIWNVCLKVSCCETESFQVHFVCSVFGVRRLQQKTKMRNNVNFAFRLIGFTLLCAAKYAICNTIKPFNRRLFTLSFFYRFSSFPFHAAIECVWRSFKCLEMQICIEKKNKNWNFFHDILHPREFLLSKTMKSLYIGFNRINDLSTSIKNDASSFDL